MDTGGTPPPPGAAHHPGESRGRRLSLLFGREEIAREVKRLAGEISRDHRGETPLLTGVLTGSFIFMADLSREIDIPLAIDFMDASSYRGVSSAGRVTVSRKPAANPRGRPVILVDDILDTGLTAAHLTRLLQNYRPRSVKFCALLDKPSRRVEPFRADYVGFTIPDKFVVGYGLDLDENYRNLPDIYTVSEGVADANLL